MGKQFADVSSARGAPMGRQAIFDSPDATVIVFKVRMIDGDYDDGGAYWGGPPSDPVFCARGEGFLTFTRAKNAIEARAYFEKEYPQLDIARDDEAIIAEFTEGYLTCAAWADAPDGSTARFTKQSRAEALVDCQQFISDCGPLFYEALELRDAEHLGHDFWLTRNGRGTGFWDRKELEVKDIGRDLSTLCKDLRSISLYAERGWLHFDI